MATPITYVENTTTQISAEFVKLTISSVSSGTTTSTVYTFSTAYRNETIGGVEYDALGGLVTIGEQHRDLKATSFDTTISLTGVDPNIFAARNIYLVLEEQMRGSVVEIYRGFYDNNHVLADVVPRFKGIVTSYSVSESLQNDMDMFTINISCSSYKKVLENNTGGRRTNEVIWKKYDPTDTSMDNVTKIAGRYFDFGLPPPKKPQAAGPEYFPDLGTG